MEHFIGEVYLIQRYGEGYQGGYGVDLSPDCHLAKLTVPKCAKNTGFFRSLDVFAKYLSMEGPEFWYKNFKDEVTWCKEGVVLIKQGLSENHLELLAKELAKLVGNDRDT